MMLSAVVVMVVQLSGWLHASPVGVTINTTVGDVTFDPMTSSPQLTFNTTARLNGDEKEPDYSAIASTADGNYLLMVDTANRKVKVMATSSGTPYLTSSMILGKDLWDIALLPGGMVAVTTFEDNYIYLLRLDIDDLIFTSLFRTGKQYMGVTAGLDNVTLVVTSRDYLDVITLKGDVVESYYLWQFRTPVYVCRAGGDDVIVSDWARGVLFIVDARTGEVWYTLRHRHMKKPHQVAVDKGGNVYVASRGSNRVMVVSPYFLEWRTLLQGSKAPTSISVIDDDVIVSWSDVTVTADREVRPWSVIEGYAMTA